MGGLTHGSYVLMEYLTHIFFFKILGNSYNTNQFAKADVQNWKMKVGFVPKAVIDNISNYLRNLRNQSRNCVFVLLADRIS